ncbi:hypothetical protein ACFFX0_14890 [Citricoccus parietis]|uniref:Uncharacterized protein n=1 Tax=Citricoccus parietis TaxID=592307 RepID=A0ABV5G0E4_9MICC
MTRTTESGCARKWAKNPFGALCALCSPKSGASAASRRTLD